MDKWVCQSASKPAGIPLSKHCQEMSDELSKHFDKSKASGVGFIFVSMVLQISYVYNVGAVCFAPKWHNTTVSLPYPRASVGHLHGDRKVTMVIKWVRVSSRVQDFP